MKSMDPVLDTVVEQSRPISEIQRVIVFGSRARGDARERSDYDIAFDAPQMSVAQWVEFSETLQEKVPTLCELDLVWIQDVQNEDLLTAIRKEGKVALERS